MTSVRRIFLNKNMNINKTILSENKKRYDSGAIVSEYMKEDYHKIRVKKAINLITQGINLSFGQLTPQNIRILEIAGAEGIVSNELSQMGYSVLLTDSEEEPLKKAQNNNTLLKTLIMDASEKFPFKNNSFHVIYAGEIIEHLFDTKFFLKEVHRCLVPNGIVVLTTPNLAALEDRVRFLFGKSPRQINPTHEYLYLHIRPFTYSKLKEIMKTLAFDDFKLNTNLIRFKVGVIKKDLFKISDYFPSLGRSLIISAKARKE